MNKIFKTVLLYLALVVGAAAGDAPKVTIEVIGKGEIAIDDLRCALGEAPAALKEKRAAQPQIVAVILAKSDADLATVTTVIEACRTAGILKFSLQSR